MMLKLLAFLLVISFSGVSKDAETANTDPCLDDGPHLYWQEDTTAIVLYFRDGCLRWKAFSAADTLRFEGFGSTDADMDYSISVAPPAPCECQFDGVQRFMALSDIHGDFGSFRDILVNTGVIDGNDDWSWGDGHLVINGDVFDRGDEVTECLWLIYRLQRQAPLSGGAVHFTIGNHELMVLRGDLRYVSDKYLKGITGSTGIDYDELFGPETELGRWLRTLPSAVRINDVLFVHAGIAPLELLDFMSIGEMNRLVRSGLDASSMKLMFDETMRSLYGSRGPFWYRGYHYEMEGYYPMASSEEVDEALNFYAVDRIVVGHTERDSLEVLYDGRVIAIDVPVEDLGGQQALLFEGGDFYRVNPDGERMRIILPE